MISLEQEVRDYLLINNYRWSDSTGSMTTPDFGILLSTRVFQLEVKEKQKPYTASNWGIPEKDEVYTFILDDLSARKILRCSPSALLIRNVEEDYFIFTDLDLSLIPKKRVNRKINKVVDSLKGKWLIDLRSATRVVDLEDALSFLKEYQLKRNNLYLEGTACYGNYHNEDVGIAGTVRTSKYWKQDLASTR